MPQIDSVADYNITISNIQTSDVERKVKLTYAIKTKKLSAGNEVSLTKEYELDGFNEDVPKNVVTFTRKNNTDISLYTFNDYYNNNIKSLELVTASYNGASDGWQLDQSSIVAYSLENNNAAIKFKYKLYKDIKAFDGTKKEEKTFAITVDFTGQLDKNIEREKIMRIYHASEFQITYQGAKPMIDKVDINKFRLENSNWKYYKATFSTELVNYNFKNGYLFVKANINDKGNGSHIGTTNDSKITGFTLYDYEGGNPIKQWNNFSNLVINDDKLYSTNFVLSKYFKTLTSEGIINSLKSILKNNGEFDSTFNYEFLKGKNNTFINEYSAGTLTFLKLKIKRDIPAATSYFDTTKSEWAKEISPTLDFVSLFKNNLERNYQSIFSALTIDANKFFTLNSRSFAL